MQVKQRAKQSQIEIPLVISDHSDWNELTNTIKQTGAEKVWITHGREDALKYWCEKTGFKLSRFLFNIEMKQANYNERFFEFTI